MDLFIKNYDVGGHDILIFEQHFPDGVANASVANHWNSEIADNAATVVQTGFPVIQVPKEDTGLGFITPGGNMMGNTKLSFGSFHNLSMEDGKPPLPKESDGGFFIDGRQDPGSESKNRTMWLRCWSYQDILCGGHPSKNRGYVETRILNH